jgi:hypothetical protein
MSAFNPHRNRTIDGVPVTPGLAVWDYNLNLSVVTSDPDAGGMRCPDYCGKDHWFATTGGSFNGSRMWVRHPSTGAKAAVR